MFTQYIQLNWDFSISIKHGLPHIMFTQYIQVNWGFVF